MALIDWRNWLVPSPDLNEVDFWALDLETSGVKAGLDAIVSVGMVPIRRGVIKYGEQFHCYVRPPNPAAVPTDGIRAHHILPGDLESAPSLADVLPDVDRRLRDGVLLVHFAALDLAFLKDAYRRQATPWPEPIVVDTVDLILRLQRRREQWMPYPTPMRTSLAESRAALGLPAYPGHDALIDALATAELYLVLRHRLGAYKLRHIR